MSQNFIWHQTTWDTGGKTTSCSTQHLCWTSVTSFSLWPLWSLKTDGSVAAETPVLKSFECKSTVVRNEWSEARFRMVLKYACLGSDDPLYHQNHDCHAILKPFLIWHLWFVGCCGIQFQFHNKMKSSTITYKRSAESCYTRLVQQSQQSRNWRNSTG